jgi:hypothetical protein
MRLLYLLSLASDDWKWIKMKTSLKRKRTRNRKKEPLLLPHTPLSILAVCFCECCASSHSHWWQPAEHEIHLSAYYNPRLLPDYGGDLFHHNTAKLVQHDVRDIDNHLIPPGKYYEKLRPGTMVLCNVTMHVYWMTSMKQTKVRKVCSSSLPLVSSFSPVSQI